jgi:hypothetical protein
MHSYYHLVPLVCCYCSVGYLSDSIDYSSSSYLDCFTNVSVFPCILSLMGIQLALLADVVFEFKSFSEAPHLAWKCGTRRSDSPDRAL